MKNEYLKVSEAAEVTRLSPYRIRQLLNKGRINGVRPGGRGSWRIPVAAIRAYMGDAAARDHQPATTAR